MDQDLRKYLSGDGRSAYVHVSAVEDPVGNTFAYVWKKTVIPVTVGDDNSVVVGAGVPLGVPPTSGRDILHPAGNRSFARLVYLDASGGQRALRVGECSFENNIVVTMPVDPPVTDSILWDTYHATRTQEWYSLTAHAEWPQFGSRKGIYVSVHPVTAKVLIDDFIFAPSFIRVWPINDPKDQRDTNGQLLPSTYLLLFPTSPSEYKLHLLRMNWNTLELKSIATTTQRYKGNRAFFMKLAEPNRFLLNTWYDNRVVSYDVSGDTFTTVSNSFPTTTEDLLPVGPDQYFCSDGYLRTATGAPALTNTSGQPVRGIGFPEITNVGGLMPLGTGRVVSWRDFIGKVNQGFIFLEARNVYTAMNFSVQRLDDLFPSLAPVP